ncbi:hypothetical protein Y032_0121g1022 [Ancylostoma ceylanicum]|uniref:Uncharacterized protein n=1 Tax=Ancylostoma ceylanicum TaxID=53326 RepID=A0A016TA91_9BILA|nr:hypothetical protein Y032_0121g1022 [Ancylostoma ceylanicum]
MSYSHAVVVGVPNSLKFANKKSALDTDALRKQSEGLIETLREAGNLLDLRFLRYFPENSVCLGVVVSEYCPENDSSVSSLLVGDAAVSVHGTTLLCRPKKPGISHSEASSGHRRSVPHAATTLFSFDESYQNAVELSRNVLRLSMGRLWFLKEETYSSREKRSSLVSVSMGQISKELKLSPKYFVIMPLYLFICQTRLKA